MKRPSGLGPTLRLSEDRFLRETKQKLVTCVVFGHLGEVRRAREGILDFEDLEMARRRMCELTRGRYRAVSRLCL